MIPDTEFRNIWTIFSHDPCNLVTQHRWCRHDIVRSKQQDGVTKAGGLHVDENFASNRRGDLDVFEIKPMTQCV